MPSTQLLKIGHGNVHNEFAGIEKVLSFKPDSAGFNEAHRQLDRLRGVPNYRMTVPGKSRGAGDVPLLVKTGRRDLGGLQRQISERIPAAIRVAPDRHLNSQFYVHPLATELGFEGVAHFNIHPDAGPKQLEGDDPNAGIVREYREALASTRKWMKSAREDNLLLVLTGDLQVGENHSKPWSPRRVIAQPLKLKMATTKIDWVMFDARLELARPLDVFALYDHNGFLATLRAA